MSQGIDGDSTSAETQTNALGVNQSAHDYTPGEDETAEETAKNILDLLEKESADTGETDPEPSAEEGDQAESTLAAEPVEQREGETPAQAAQRQRDENGRFVKSQESPQKPANSGEIPSVLTDPAARKAYMNMPEGVKRSFNDMVKRQQAHFTQKTQEASGKINQATSIVDGATNYINTQALIDGEGRRYTPERLFTELLSAHHNIVSDPDRHIAEMIASNPSANLENIQAYLRGENPNGVNISNDPTIRGLQQRQESVTERLDRLERASTDARIAPAAQEFSAVMHEVDQNGEYVRPELHNDDFLESTKPIVAALLRTNPNLGRGEALKRAHATLTGQTYSQNNNPTILPARQNNLERARSAAVSVRGAIAPTGSTQMVALDQMDASEIPDSIEETVRMAMRQHSAG